MKEGIDKLDFIKVKFCCPAKDSQENEKTNHRIEKKYLQKLTYVNLLLCNKHPQSYLN